MANISMMIFGERCVGHKCMDMVVVRPTTYRRARSLLYLKNGLGKAKYLSLANWNFRVRRLHTLIYVVKAEHSS